MGARVSARCCRIRQGLSTFGKSERLSEKKVVLGQLVGIGPGAIISFEKSCEDLLDLYINNKLYCRGEAVKIGEKFGLKINEVGSVEERVSALLGPTG